MNYTLIPSLVLAFSYLLSNTGASAEDLSMTVDAARTGAPIHRYVYGQFTELLGNMYEKGIWAEMLSDRKFFYPIDSSDTLTPTNRKPRFNRWRPTEAGDFIVMDKSNAFVGEHSPMIKLRGDFGCGITQSGVVVRKGRKYTGYIVLSGTRDANVSVSLGGERNGPHQTIGRFSRLSKKYTRFPLNFTADMNSDNARFTI